MSSIVDVVDVTKCFLDCTVLLSCWLALLALHECCHLLRKIETFFNVIVLGGWPPPAPAPAQQPAPVQSAIGKVIGQ